MKLNKILMALSAMAIVGCSSEDFNDPSVTQAIDDSRLIQLDENFVLAGVGEVDNTTRTHWEQNKETKALGNKFLPIWKTETNTTGHISDYADLTKQAVGLCWLGNGAAGTDVYTNYEFYHFGWLNNDETKAEVECNALTNGSLYSDIKTTAEGAAGDEAIPTEDWGVAGLLAKSKTDDGKDNLNYNSGVYKTDNKAIFGGQYIVYYPYNPSFKDAGTIPAIAETQFGVATALEPADATKDAPTALTSPVLGHATFRYSAPVTIEGGNQAADFGLKNLSALVQLRVAAAHGYAGTTKFDQIVLYSAKEQLLKQANLAADKIAAGATGADLYASKEGTKTIVANAKNAPIELKATDAKDDDDNSLVKSAYITVLPTKVEDLVVLVHSTAGKWAQVSLPNTEFKAGAAKRLDITVADADFKSNFIAVDQASLVTALNEARPLATDKDHAQTITVIGDIKLTADLAINNDKDAFITIKGGDIIVPEDRTLTLKTNMESNVRVLGRSCCSGNAGGILNIAGGTISNVTMEKTEVTKPDNDDNPTLNYTGAATVAAGKTIDVKAGKVEVNAAVAHKGDIKIAEDAIVTVKAAGGLNFMGSNVTNDGTIEVEKNGNFNMTNSDGGATAAAGKRMTNNGTFIHNVDAGVGTAVQSMNQNGEYRCRVDQQTKLDDAYQQWTACSVIEMVNADPINYNLGIAESNINYQHNGKYIDIEVNAEGATTFNNAAMDNKEIKIGKLTVTKGELTIDFVKDNGFEPTHKDYKIGKRTLIVNGDMTVAANTEFTSSKKINITGNLTVKGGKTLTYKGAKANVEGLAVTKDITVNGENSIFDANEVDALNITCANFYLKSKGQAKFGNRTDGAAKNMVVSGTIDNPATCTFTITAANQNGEGSVLAWVTCKELKVGGTFTGAQPRVE